MADRTVRTIVEAKVDGFVAGMKTAADAAKTFASGASKGALTAGSALAKVARENQSEWRTVSTAALTAGAAIAAGLGLTVKAAMDWESAWAGVQKTVDGSASEMAALEASLRSMARELPASHTEIAAVAEAAGQLGIARQDIAKFTHTMIAMGETTNLSADMAATSLAQFMNVMGTSTSDVDRLASAVVALGNDGASTEAQIVEMGQRISAAGRQVGMSEADVMGLASALASVGINAEAGGTSASMALMKLDAAVRSGGERLGKLAQISGMTVEEFKKAWQTDAAGALSSFTEGLGSVQKAGGSVRAELKALGITGEREVDAMGRLAGATQNAGGQLNMLRDSLSTSKDAWAANSALQDEFSKRLATTESQMGVARNRLVDLGISLGQTLLPAVNSTLAVFAAMVDAVGSIPGPVMAAGAAVAALAAGALLAGGGLMKFIAWAGEVRAAITTLRAAIEASRVSFAGVGLAAGAIGIALSVAGVAFASWVERQNAAKQAADEFAAALQNSNGVIDESIQKTMSKRLSDDGALDAAKQLGIEMGVVQAAAMGNAAAMQKVEEATRRYNQATMGTTTVDSKYAANQRAARELKDSIEKNNEALNTEAARIRDVGNASGEASSAIDRMTDETQQQTEAMNQLVSATQAYGKELLKLSGGEIAFEQAIDDATDALKKNGRNLDLNTKSGRANQTALNTLIKTGQDHIRNLVETSAASKDVEAAQARAREQYIQAATGMGMARDEAASLADALFGIPKNVKTNVTDNGTADAFTARVQRLSGALNSINNKTVRAQIQALINQGSLDEAERRLNNIARTRSVIYRATLPDLNGSASGSGRPGIAQGAVLDYYARGGLVRGIRAESHVAQIAPAGAWRVWAEPETGGEAYIPLAAAKRPRSKAITEQVVSRFGGSVSWHAEGAFIPAVTRGPAPVVASSGLSAGDVAAALSGLRLRVDLDNGVAWFTSMSNRADRGQVLDLAMAGMNT